MITRQSLKTVVGCPFIAVGELAFFLAKVFFFVFSVPFVAFDWFVTEDHEYTLGNGEEVVVPTRQITRDELYKNNLTWRFLSWLFPEKE